MKLDINFTGIKREVQKLKTIAKNVKITGKKSPRLAATYMVRTARVMAPVKKGILRKNINAFKRGKNSYEVISHRFPRADESTRRNFPVHAWVDGRITGGWKRGPYSATIHTGTPGYFTKAAKKTQYRFFKMIVEDVRKGLRIKI